MRQGKALALRASVLTALLTMFLVGVPPAGASPTSQYIHRMYTDFLLRDPSDSDVTYWENYLASHSRGDFVNLILTSNEFDGLWSAGISAYYLGNSTSSSINLVLSTLQSSNSWYQAELALLASTEFFNSSGGTNSGFVAKLYDRVMMRDADSSGQTYWTSQLASGTKTRTQVASYFIKTLEATQRRISGAEFQIDCTSTLLGEPDALYAGSYCLVLDRMSDSSGATYWEGQLQPNGELPNLWKSHAASSEYFNH